MNNLILNENPKSSVAEAYREIRTNIEFANLDKNLKTIVVTSCRQNEGKSTVMANLALSFAKLEKKVILVDCDLRNPTTHRLFGHSNLFGLTDILKEQKTIEECILNINDYGLHILSSGALPPNPSEVLASKKMKELINCLGEKYDYVFIDAPPIGIITDAGIISTYTDGTLLVVGSNEVDAALLKLSKERLDKINANIIGVVLNKFAYRDGYYGYYKYYNYSYGEYGK